MPSRRATLLLLPGLVAGCAGPEPVPPPPGPMAFRHLTPLPLNVAAIELAPTAPAPLPGDIGLRLSPSPIEAVRIMGRDRLYAVGTAGQANFAVSQASLVRGRDALTCLVGCRLEIVDAAGARLGFVEAQSRRAVTGRDASRPGADAALLRQAMDDLNVEFEYQLRRTLREWLVRVTPGQEGAPPPGGVTREDLPET